VEVAAWCDEEGHFGHFLGSRSYVGDVTDQDIDAARDRTDKRDMRVALQAAGLAGRRRATAERGRHIGYLEAHIEQGRTLEGSRLGIGVVTSIVGIWQYQIAFTGEQNHAGTTRMKDRRDAGLALARLCVAIDDRFPANSGPRTVWTTGRMILERLEALLREIATEIAVANRCDVDVKRIRTGKPAMMDERFQRAIEQAASVWANGKSVRMPSGAGHDAQVLATIMPAGMLFVPSIGGISHHWDENTDDTDIVTGADVFVETCRRLLAN
jgi:N-carbamoyl-L-amino-acid hydrolase